MNTWFVLIGFVSVCGVIEIRASTKVLTASPLFSSSPSVWTVNVGKSGGFVFRPAVDGTRIYTAAGDGTVSVVELDNGKIASRFETKKKLSGGVSAGEGKVVAGTLKGEVVALDEDGGKAAWTTSVAGWR